MGSAGWVQAGFWADCSCHSQRQSTPPQLTTGQCASNLPCKTSTITIEKFIEIRVSYKIINLSCHLGLPLSLSPESSQMFCSCSVHGVLWSYFPSLGFASILSALCSKMTHFCLHCGDPPSLLKINWRTEVTLLASAYSQIKVFYAYGSVAAILREKGWAFWGEVPRRNTNHYCCFSLARPEDDVWSRCLQFRDFAVPREMGGKKEGWEQSEKAAGTRLALSAPLLARATLWACARHGLASCIFHP